mgnify:CR=1 FL=1
MIWFEKKYYLFEAQRIVSDMLIPWGNVWVSMLCSGRLVWYIA